jgi:hypothetical protein
LVAPSCALLVLAFVLGFAQGIDRLGCPSARLPELLGREGARGEALLGSISPFRGLAHVPADGYAHQRDEGAGGPDDHVQNVYRVLP